MFNDVADWHSPLLFFLTMGFYGGWMPLICLVLCLFYDRCGAVMLLPMLLCFGILVIGPASSVRYAVPLLYAAPLMMGVLCQTLGRARVGARVAGAGTGDLRPGRFPNSAHSRPPSAQEQKPRFMARISRIQRPHR